MTHQNPHMQAERTGGRLGGRGMAGTSGVTLLMLVTLVLATSPALGRVTGASGPGGMDRSSEFRLGRADDADQGVRSERPGGGGVEKQRVRPGVCAVGRLAVGPVGTAPVVVERVIGAGIERPECRVVVAHLDLPPPLC